jgi:hypothetical protein
MSMEQLARQIASINARGESTPVLVTPAYLSLRAPFLVALATELTALKPNAIRFDWYRGMPGAFSFAGDWLARWKVQQINRALTRQMRPLSDTATIQITAAIGRPDKAANQWVLGISSEQQPLPAWTTPVFLITSPIEQQDASPEPIFHLQSQKMVSAA